MIWTVQEESYLRMYYRMCPSKFIAIQLGKSVAAINCKAAKIGIKKNLKGSQLKEPPEHMKFNGKDIFGHKWKV